MTDEAQEEQVVTVRIDGAARRLHRQSDGSWSTHTPAAAAVAAMQRADFKVGDVVQFKSGGHAMMVEGLDCCGCHALIYSRKGVVAQLDVPGVCLQPYDSAMDREYRDGGIPF